MEVLRYREDRLELVELGGMIDGLLAVSKASSSSVLDIRWRLAFGSARDLHRHSLGAKAGIR